jgi:response regulator RpfG family c-di-GMP phosphodiesterase
VSEEIEILIVEDSPTQALRLKNTLKEQGYRVQMALHGKEALGLPKDQPEGIRVASLLHDIGKISVPIEILSRPGQIRDFELNIINIHK